jgi:hypothetical protein
MLETLYSLGALGTIVLAAFGVGRPIVRRLDVGNEGTPATWVWSLSVGLVVWGCTLWFAALVGWLSPGLVGLLTVAASFWGLGELACAYLAICNPLDVAITRIDERENLETRAPSRSVSCFVGIAVLATLSATLVSALAPPISPAGLARDLEIPKTLLLGEHVSLTSCDGQAAAPQLVSMLYVWAMTLDGPVTATLVTWLCGVLLAAATALLTKPLLGRSWARCSGAMVLLVPGITYQMTVPLDDLACALFCVLALAAWWRGVVELFDERWFYVAGLFAGGALFCKPIALAWLLAIAITWCYRAWRHAESREMIQRGSIKVFAVAGLICWPWYAWALWRQVQIATFEPGNHLLVQLGPLLVAAVPGMLLVRRLRGLPLMFSTLFLFLLISMLLVPGSRSFAIAAPLCTLPIVWMGMELSRLPRLPRTLIQTSAAALILMLVSVTVWRSTDCLPVVLGMESRTTYLRARMPTYAAAEITKRVSIRSAKLLSEDARGLYFDCSVVAADDFFDRHPRDQSDDRPNNLVTELKREGFTHVLLCDSIATPTASTPLNRAIEAELAKPIHDQVLPLTDYRVTGRTGSSTRYRLLMLR